jgi:hypothetical protein
MDPPPGPSLGPGIDLDFKSFREFPPMVRIKEKGRKPCRERGDHSSVHLQKVNLLEGSGSGLDEQNPFHMQNH